MYIYINKIDECCIHLFVLFILKKYIKQTSVV